MSNLTAVPPLQFGVNPYDRVPQNTGRYHVINPQGFIVAKYAHGFTAFDDAGSRSDREPGEWRAIDTRDGSEYGAYSNGEVIR